MSDLVVTVPKGRWADWLWEGDLPGDAWTGETWGFFVGHRAAPRIECGDRLYIVAWGRLRGYALVTHVDYEGGPGGRGYGICREGGAVACTTDEPIRGFQGWRAPSFLRGELYPFPGWMTEGVTSKSVLAEIAALESEG